MSSPLRRIALLITTILAAFIGVAVTHSAIAAPALRPNEQTVSPVPDVCTWLDCKSGAISYSQDDDGNVNSSNSCQAPLEAAGFRGTFYYNGTNTEPWMAAVSAAGHEVGSHWADHARNCTTPPSCFEWPGGCTPENLWLTPYTEEELTWYRQYQIEPNVTAIETATGKPVVSTAYPCGCTDAARMTAAQYYFASARGYLNPWDCHLLWMYDVNQSTPAEYMNLNSDLNFSTDFVDRAVSEGIWDIVVMHDVCMGIDYISSMSNSLWVAPVGDVLKYIRVRNATQITNYSRAGFYIHFDAVHNLPTFERQLLDGTPLLSIVYDNPVTLRTPITTTANVVSVLVNGASISYTVGMISGTKYVWFNTPLNTIQHVAIQLDTPTAVRLTNLQVTRSASDMTLALIVAGSAGVCAIAVWKQQRRRRHVS